MMTDGAARRVALGGIAASIVIGLAACGSTVAGASGSARQAATSKPATSKVNPGGPMLPSAASRDVLLCAEVPKLTRLSFIRTAWPPDHHAREALPGAAVVRNTAAVRRIATVLCALPTVPFGVMSCPDLTGGSYRLYFVGPGRAIPAVGIQTSGCRVVTGVGRSRTWATSKALQHALSQGLGSRFREAAPPS
jgi:hypothetical protein